MAWVTVAAFRDPSAAHVAASRLQAEGMPTNLLDLHLVSLDWLRADSLGGVKLQVPEALAGRARRALDADEGGRGDASEARHDDPCPSCGSPDVVPHPLARRSKAALMIVGLPFVLGRRKLACRACGHAWRRRR